MAAEFKLQKIGTAQPVSASSIKDETPMWRKGNFLDRLRWQESGPYIGDAERANASGDEGVAIGPYQIWPVYVDQANKLNREKGLSQRFSLKDRLDRTKSEEIIDTVLPWAISNFKNKYGRNPNETELARLHHTGGLVTGRHWGSPKDIAYGEEFDKKGALLAEWESSPYGYRRDDTRKGRGYLGPQKIRDKSGRIIPNSVATELSVTIGIDGKEILVPALIPTLNEQERRWILTEGNNPINNPIIMNKVVNFAKNRLKKGYSPFYDTPPGIKPRAPSRASLVTSKNEKKQK